MAPKSNELGLRVAGTAPNAEIKASLPPGDAGGGVPKALALTSPNALGELAPKASGELAPNAAPNASDTASGKGAPNAAADGR